MSQVFAAVKALIVKEGKILVLKQTIDDTFVWDLPGGKVDFGENPYNTLLREVKEETDLDITVVKPLGMWWFFRKKDGNQVICNTFLCTPNNEAIDLTRNPMQENITEFVWVTPEQFLQDKMSMDNQNLDNIIKAI